jgi:glycosyltransferase involved in cell wall biosynthesis
MKISFAICTHNEGHYVQALLDSLLGFIQDQDFHTYEIVIVDDWSTDKLTLEVLESCKGYPFVKSVFHALDNDFAAHKNFMNEQCTGDWILNLDADETIPWGFLDIMPLILEANPLVDAYWLPRVNTVDGLTLRHVQKWQWVISTLPGFRHAEMLDPKSPEYELLSAYKLIVKEEDGVVTFDKPIICWPDMQMRLYRNSKNIQWVGKVHERLVGFENFSMMPSHPDYAIRHFKTIDRQEKQNDYYDTIQR